MPERTFLGPDGPTNNIEEATDIRGPAGRDGRDGTPAPAPPPAEDGTDGNNGWTPALATITRGNEEVHQVIDWFGGNGTKPATGQYIGETGFVTAIADAKNIKGSDGQPGADSTVPGPPGQDGRSTGACIEETVLDDDDGSQALTVVTLPADYADYKEVYVGIYTGSAIRGNAIPIATLIDGRAYRVARPIDVTWNESARTLTLSGGTATFRHVILKGCATVDADDWGHVEPHVLAIRYTRPNNVDADNNPIEYAVGPNGDGYIRVEGGSNVTWFRIPGTNLILFYGAIDINAPRPLVQARIFLRPFAGAGRIVRTQGIATVHGGREWYGCHINSAQHDNYPDGEEYNSIEVSAGDASQIGEGHTFNNNIHFSGIYEIYTE